MFWRNPILKSSSDCHYAALTHRLRFASAICSVKQKSPEGWAMPVDALRFSFRPRFADDSAQTLVIN